MTFLGHREADQRRDLLGLAEVLVRRRLQPLPFQRDDALVARGFTAAIDGEGEVAVAEQVAVLGRLRQALGIVAGEGADAVGRVEIDHQHVDEAVALRLQLEAPLHLQRGAEQHGEGRRLADEAGHRRRVLVLAQDVVDAGAEPHHAAAHVERLDGEGQDAVVVSLVRHGTDGVDSGHRHPPAPRHQVMMPFCTCRRFSASSKTTEREPSITSSLTSSPRWAGRQCMKSASGAARAISAAFTW